MHIAWVRFAGAENLLFQGGVSNCKGEQISSEYEEFMDTWTDIPTFSNGDISLPGFQQAELLEAVASPWKQLFCIPEGFYPTKVWDGFSPSY